MKYIVFIFSLFLYSNTIAQHRPNTANGIAVEGYDVVAYFTNTAIKGNKEY
jgi:hypothetical protein